MVSVRSGVLCLSSQLSGKSLSLPPERTRVHPCSTNLSQWAEAEGSPIYHHAHLRCGQGPRSTPSTHLGLGSPCLESQWIWKHHPMWMGWSLENAQVTRFYKICRANTAVNTTHFLCIKKHILLLKLQSLKDIYLGPEERTQTLCNYVFYIYTFPADSWAKLLVIPAFYIFLRLQTLLKQRVCISNPKDDVNIFKRQE